MIGLPAGVRPAFARIHAMLILAGVAFGLGSIASSTRASVQNREAASQRADSAAASAPADLAGHWDGAIELPNMKLVISIEFEKDKQGWTGTISIPAQGVKDSKLDNIQFTGRRASWDFPGPPGNPNFKGRLAADGKTLKGDFNQAIVNCKFNLTRGPTAADRASDALAGFADWIDQARADWKVPGVAVAIVQGDKVIFAHGSGWRDVEHKRPVTTKTLFAIGSSTKAFTTFLLGTLVDENKIEWDKPVRTWMPEFRLHDPVSSERVTPRDLVTHRTGLPRHDLVWYNSKLGLADLVARLPYLEANKDLRTDWQYNNLMFGAAGRLVERVTHDTWEHQIRERILSPLGMSHTNVSVVDSQKSDDFARPYEERDDKVREMPFRNITGIGPAGSINSCVDDMARWLRLHLGDGTFEGHKLISKETLADLHQPHMIMENSGEEVDDVITIGYGCGWFVDSYRGHLRVHHGGNIDGFSALICMLPKERIGTVILCNMNGSPLPGLINRHAIDRLLKLEAKDHNAAALAKVAAAKETIKQADKNRVLTRHEGTHPAHDLKEYVGDYEQPGYGIIRIGLSGKALTMTYNSIVTPMEHWHYETFNCTKDAPDHTFENFKIEFVTDMAGDVAALQAPMEPSIDPIVFKRRPDTRLTDPEYLKRFVGEFELSPQVVTVSLDDRRLMCHVPGQPTYELMPKRGSTFDLKGLTGFAVTFTCDEKGYCTQARFDQPNGVFVMKRKK